MKLNNVNVDRIEGEARAIQAVPRAIIDPP